MTARLTVAVICGAALLGPAGMGVAVAAKSAPSASCDAPSYDGTNYSIHCTVPQVTQTVTVTRTPTPPSTTRPRTTPSPTSLSATTWRCTTSSPSGNCGPYDYNQITNSNGYNTYVGNNCWADPSCKQKVSANNPGDWQVVSTEPAHNTGVKTYPDVQQLFNDWCGGHWNNCANMTNTPLSGLSLLRSTYAETTPHNAATIAQFAWDIWLDHTTGPNEIMVWVDNSNRGSGGATKLGTASIGGQNWTLYQYGGGEIIWSLGTQGRFAQQPSGTVHLLALLRNLQSRGKVSAGATIGQIDAGWEICSTGGSPETFRVSRYAVTAVAR